MKLDCYDKYQKQIDHRKNREGEKTTEPELYRFKWICADCKNIDDIIKRLEDVTVDFKKMKKKGYTIGGSIEDDYMEIIPPKRKTAKKPVKKK